MEVEIDQTVYQKGTTAEEAGEVERGSERLVSLENLSQRDEKERAEEPNAANSAGDSGFGEHFEVVVMCMVDDLAIVLGLVGGEDGLQGAEARAGVFVVEKDTESVLPHRGALAGRDFEALQRVKAIENLFDSEPGDEEEGEEQDESAGEHVAAAGAPEQRDQEKQAHLDAERDDASAGSAKKERADREQSADGDDEPALAADFAEHERHERNGDDEFGESGEMVAIDVWAEGDAPVAHLAEPVELPIESELLEDAERGDEKTENHDEPDVATPVVGVAEGLRGEEEDEDVGDEEIELHARVVGGGGGAEEQLPERDGGEQDERREKRGDVDALLVVALVEIKEEGPEEEEEAGAGFDDGARPVFDAAVREHGEDDEHADGEAEELHVAGLGDEGGDLAGASLGGAFAAGFFVGCTAAGFAVG